MFLLQLPRIMVILSPVLLLLLSALALVILRFTRPNFKYPWIVAAAGAFAALVGVFLWQIRLPQTISLPTWRPENIFSFIPTWVGDGTSWPYAVALATLATTVIWTSVVRAENNPMTWAGTLTLTAFGILAISAGNPLTMVLAWSVIDLAELAVMLRSTEGEAQNRGVIVAFSVRLAGSGLVLWANLTSTAAGTPLDFNTSQNTMGIYLLIAAGLRLGVLPLHLPYRKENVLRRGFGTTLRLVSAAASLVLLSRVPASALESRLTPYLLILAAVTALYAGWMWLRASDEIVGRPFWVLGLASLAVANSLRGNPTGSTGWGVGLILCGALLFLFSSRQKRIMWIPLLGLWMISTLPFSLTSSTWQAGNSISWLFAIPFLPAQALLMTGFVRHTFHPGETSLESFDKWVKVIYPLGLSLMAAAGILLGFWGWDGAGDIGVWSLAIVVILLAAGLFYLTRRFINRIPAGRQSAEWSQIFPLRWLYTPLSAIYQFFHRIADVFTSSLEGEGGLLWSFLLLVLMISILSTRGQ